jgi:hypothetical protein
MTARNNFKKMKWSLEGESDEVETMYRMFTGQPSKMVPSRFAEALGYENR